MKGAGVEAEGGGFWPERERLQVRLERRRTGPQQYTTKRGVGEGV